MDKLVKYVILQHNIQEHRARDVVLSAISDTASHLALSTETVKDVLYHPDAIRQMDPNFQFPEPPPALRLYPTKTPMATLSGTSIWGEPFSVTLYADQAPFIIGRKNPRAQLDLSEYTDVRTISHTQAVLIYNRQKQGFDIENRGRNKLFVNDVPVTHKTPLAHGDVITVSHTTTGVHYRLFGQ